MMKILRLKIYMVAFLRRCLTNPKSSVRNGLLWACFALYAFSVEAGGANFQSRFVEAIQAAFPANGYINKEIHDSVWDAAPPELLMELDNPKAAAAFKMQAKKLFGHAMLFQYATWDSARRTLASGKLSYHPDYKTLHKITMEEGHTTAANNGDRVIRSALNRTPIEGPQGMHYITKEMVGLILNNLDVSLERASLLFEPTWNPKMKERFLAVAHVKTISAFPYVISEAVFDELTVTSYI